MGRLPVPVRAFLFSLAIAALVYAGTFLLPMTYSSYTSLYFPQSQQSAASALSLVKPGSDGDSGVVSNLGGALTSPLVGSGAQTAMGILTSQTALREVILKFGLTKRWDLPIEKAIRKLRSNVTTSVDKNSFLILEVEADTPEESVEMVNTLLRHLDRRADELTLNVSRKNREILEAQIARSEKQLAGLQDSMVVAMRDAVVTNLPEVQRVYLDTRQRLTEARVREASARAELTALEGSLKRIYAKDGFPSNLGSVQAANASLSKLTEEIQARRLSLEEIGASFRKESPEYRAALKSVRNVESVASQVIDAERDAVTQGLTPELARAKAALAALEVTTRDYDASLSRFEKDLADSPARYASVERAQAEFSNALSGLGRLRSELELARVAELRDPSRYELVDAPMPNREPVSPRRALISGAVFLLAFALFTVPWVMRRLREEGD
ncbi:MAG: hypothetical protein M9921_11755 [Fimbriimonadaceae bacterium]|nr:hypothetical protein [Chthonomonadaceae bacterium]MCO5297522.1 hypothetical protein [Fimbriimonadaceae bacterium]